MPIDLAVNSEQICLALLRAESEDEVSRLLVAHDLARNDLWRPLGDIENNLSIVGNQQSSSTTALVEKLVNSIDHILLLECRLKGVDPESPEAPQTMSDAAQAFFALPRGDIAPLRPTDRARLAERVQLIATGDRRSPCYTIVDSGEGQRPVDFPNSFCSLVRSNKLRVPFVQGKFNMGGSGALPFCGRRNFQLIVSRRHPALVGDSTDLAVYGWGWTIVRRRDPAQGVRSSTYEYLCINGQVPAFAAPSVPALPSRDEAYREPLEWGSLVKLYSYQSEYPSAATLDLNYELSRRLYQLALPIRVCERRDYRAHSRDSILTGMSVRLADDRAGVLEEGFPDSGIMHVDGVGDVPVEVIAFRSGAGGNFLSPHAAVFVTVNGQVHGTVHRRFFAREAVKLDFLKQDLMVIVDCSNVPTRAREILFMPSRDRLRECDEQRALEDALETVLGDHPELRRLNRQRRDEALQRRLADDQPLSDALRNVIQSSPELRQLFARGVQLPTDVEPGPAPTSFVGVKFPTFFTLDASRVRGEMPVVTVPVGGTARVQFLTDAVNDYFTRRDEPGQVSVRPEGVFGRMHLRDGKAALVLCCPDKAKAGDTFEIAVEVTDPSRRRPFAHQLIGQVVESIPRDADPRERDPDTSGALALPRIIEVSEAEWEAEGFGPESGLAVLRDVDHGLIAKVNVDNRFLKASLARSPEHDREVIRRRFIYGLVLIGVSLWEEFKERDDADDQIRATTKAVARVLVPTITVLGALDAVRSEVP